jgi:hypothetical protein
LLTRDIFPFIIHFNGNLSRFTQTEFKFRRINMFIKKFVLSALAITLLATSGLSFSREAAEGPRGEGKGHKNSVDVNSMILAREAAEGPRGEGKVHKNSVDVNSMILAREAAEGPRGEGKGHKNSVDVNSMILAREATEAPRGADNNNNRQRGRNKNSADLKIIA